MKVIIVGGGLSGICLAHELEKNNIPFKIIDKGINHSTSVAAGMINPMTFRRMIKTWRGDELIPALKGFYSEIEEKIGNRFFFPAQLRRVFSSEAERKMWLEKTDYSSFSKYLNPIEKAENTPKYLKDDFGSAFVNVPGYLDGKKFMQFNHAYFSQNKNIEYESFDFDSLDIENRTYKKEPYKHLIFAEGFQGEDNPFFNYLPFKNAKGEVLTIKSNELKYDEILNRKCFVLPTANGNFKLGSTYVWDTKSVTPTEEAKIELLENYNELSSATINVIHHEAGIRPVANDRRPMIGEHPNHKELYIFNGLGAKGFMIAPFFATQFINFLKGEGEIDKEVNIERFYEKFFKNHIA